MINTILSNYGCKIKKKELSSQDIKKIKSDLTVNPFSYNDFAEKNEKRFSLFLESPNSLYIPRFYSYDNYGTPSQSKMNDGDDINITFNGSIREEQIPVVKSYLDSANKIGGGLI